MASVEKNSRTKKRERYQETMIESLRTHGWEKVGATWVGKGWCHMGGKRFVPCSSQKLFL